MAKGLRTHYSGKVQQPITTNLTAEARTALEKAEEATGASRSDLFEHAWRKAAGLPLNGELERLLVELTAQLASHNDGVTAAPV